MQGRHENSAQDYGPGAGDFGPIAAPGIGIRPARPNADGAWNTPGSNVPLSPEQAARPNAREIAAHLAAHLVTPRGPTRTASLVLGISGQPASFGSGTTPAFISVALNSKITLPVLGAPGIIRSIDFQAQCITTGAAAGVLQLYDNDLQAPLLRTFIVNTGAAGTLSIAYVSNVGSVPFLNGILAIWTPIVGAFGNSMICCNIDFESIPIGQKIEQS